MTDKFVEWAKQVPERMDAESAEARYPPATVATEFVTTEEGQR